MARPERFELPTNRFEAGYSIQLSYGRKGAQYNAPNQQAPAKIYLVPTNTQPLYTVADALNTSNSLKGLETYLLRQLQEVQHIGDL